MTAIGALFNFDGHAQPDSRARRMRESLALLGRDRSESVAAGPFGLAWTFQSGHTPQDQFEHQPVIKSGRLALLFAGFLMYREELAERLGYDAKPLVQTPDCELVSAAWLKWGEACLDRLYGTYSLIACDLEHRRLYAAQAPDGGMALYYHRRDNDLYLATSTHGLFCFPEIPKRLDENRIADSLVLMNEDVERSHFEGIGVVPKGHLLTADAGGVAVRRFYRLSDTPDMRLPSDEDYVEAARGLLADAVRSAMRAPKTPALALSAGVDSSTLALAMLDICQAGEGGEMVDAYVSVPEPGWDGRARGNRIGDESGPVRELAAANPGLNVTFLDAAGRPVGDGIDRLLPHFDMPYRGIGNLHWGMEIYRRCARDGHTVILNGVGGNATLSMGCAPILFGQWFRTGSWGRLAREVRAYANKTGIPSPRPLRWLLQTALLPLLPDGLHRMLLEARGHRIGYAEYSAIHPDFARATDIEGRLAAFGWDDRYRTPRSRRHYCELIMEAGNTQLPSAFRGPFTAVTGVHDRDPLGDRKLREFCYAIPDDQFYRDGIDRRLIKRLMFDRLPAAVRNSPRGDQSADWHLRMTRDLPRIRAELDRLAQDPVMAGRIDFARLRGALDRWPAQTPTSARDHPDFLLLRLALPRALSVADFIHQAEGSNYR